MINKLNKFAIAMMVAGATATTPSAFAGHVTNTFTNAVQNVSINLTIYTNTTSSKASKPIMFNTKALISALSNDVVDIPALSGASFTHSPSLVVSTTYEKTNVVMAVSTTPTGTNSSTNSVTNTVVFYIPTPVVTNSLILSATNGEVGFAASESATNFLTNGTQLIAGTATNGAVFTNEVFVATNITTNVDTNTLVVGGVQTNFIDTNYTTNETLGTNVVIIATNGWIGTNVGATNNVLANSNYWFYDTNSNLANYGALPGNFVASNYWASASSSLISVTNGDATNVFTNITIVTMANSTNLGTNITTNTVVTFTTNFSTNYTTNTVTNISSATLEVEGGVSTNKVFAGLDSILGMQVLQSVLISSNSTSETDYQADKFTLGFFSTNATTALQNVSLTMHGFVKLTSKDDVLASSHGVKTQVPEDTYTATVSGYGYIGGSYTTNAANGSNFVTLPNSDETPGSTGSISGSIPVVVDGTITLGAPKNVAQ